MTSRKGEFKLQSMVIALLAASLFIAVLIAGIADLSGNYDATGFDENSLSKYNNYDNLSMTVNSARDQIDQVTVDKNVFDFFADIFNSILTPFKTVYRSFSLLIGFSSNLVSDLHLYSAIGDFFITAITVLVIIGIVMFKNYMNKQK